MALSQPTNRKPTTHARAFEKSLCFRYVSGKPNLFVENMANVPPRTLGLSLSLSVQKQQSDQIQIRRGQPLYLFKTAENTHSINDKAIGRLWTAYIFNTCTQNLHYTSIRQSHWILFNPPTFTKCLARILCINLIVCNGR